MKIAINWLQNSKWFSRARNKKAPLPVIFPDKYRIVEKIGDGATSDIFHAIQLSTRNHIALKVYRPYFNSKEDERIIEQFRSEAKFLQSCQHINIVKIYDVQTIEQPYFMALEFIEGDSMVNIMEKHRNVFSLTETMQYINPICDALDYLHKQGLVYCDFKPANMMIDKQRKCTLIDFGSIRMYSSEQQDKTFSGTPEYMPPELWKRNGEISPATDIYSIGVWLYQMLAGCHPLTGKNSKQTWENNNIERIGTLHVNQQPFPASQFHSGISPAIDKILRKCVEKEINSRYQDTISLRNDLSLAIQ